MIDKKKNAQDLSMNRFKLPNGELRSIIDMDAEEQVAFILASGMKSIIELLEISIPQASQDRIFSRAKFSAMQIFHGILTDINNINGGK